MIGQNDFPITRASINLTRACNLNCSFCFTNGCTNGSIPLDMAFRAIDFLFNNAIKTNEKTVEIDFWGGEPLLEWKILQEMTIYAKKKKPNWMNLIIGGTTNGTLLTPDKFNFLDEHKIYFLLSIDGTKETHDQFRKFRDGRGSHFIVMANAKKALQKWPFLKARLSPTSENISHFYENIKYLIDFGFDNLMFSPVYEGNWTTERWQIWEDQCKLVVDLMVEKKKEGREIQIDHFISYCGIDASRWPCGAGRFYVGIDIDGAIYPCHRLNKFDDLRPWQEKETCIGHIDHGITRPEFRELFYDTEHKECGDCERLKDTPCHGGCWAVKHDLANGVHNKLDSLCNYIHMQKRVSEYYAKQMGLKKKNCINRSCICYNMCYSEGTEDEIITDDGGSATCLCNNAYYNGPMNSGLARPLRDQRAIELTNAAIRTWFSNEK